MDSENIESFDKFGGELTKNDPDAYILSNKRAVSIDEDFRLDRVIVVLKHKYSIVNKKYIASDFNDSFFCEVEDLSYVTSYSTSDEMLASKINMDEFHQILSLKLKNPGKENVIKAISFLNGLEEVLSAEPDYIYECIEDYVPNDTYFAEQWGLEKINIKDAWDITMGTTSVKVGFMEDGVSAHEDIDMGKVVQGNLEFDPNLTYEHGTHVVSVVGAITNNAKGIAGIANVGLVCLKHNYSTDFNNSLSYAANNNINIINASLHYVLSNGAPAGYNSSNAAAIQNYPGLLVCAAGNDGVNIDETPYFPAAYDFDNIITVASTTIADTKRADSNYGINSVDLGAPGNGIHYLHPDNTYKSGGGTSIATPFVTGVAALLKSKYPEMSAETIKYYIENGVDKIAALGDKVATGGRLNAYKALNGVKTFKVRYDANGGTGTMADTTVIYNNITKLRANQFTYTGAEFAGWCAYRQSDNKWLYTNGSTNKWFVEGAEDDGYKKYVYRNQQTLAKTSSVNNDVITMQAQWNYKITVNFNANTGSGTMQSTTVDLTKSSALPANGFSKTGYRFDHWYIKNEEGKTFCFKGTNTKWYMLSALPSDYHRKEFGNGATVNKNILTGLENGDAITLYAYWEPTTATLGDVDKNGLVSVIDASLVRKYLANTISLSQSQIYIADVDYSGSITIKDASNIEKYVADTLRYFID